MSQPCCYAVTWCTLKGVLLCSFSVGARECSMLYGLHLLAQWDKSWQVHCN